tara:strand:+ start:586 stop:957 length:372 start_codon:yes stop_codon:yes gene_type:complete
MEKAKFGLVWRWTDYCYDEITKFIERADNIPNDDGLQERYIDFLLAFLNKEIKKATEVPLNVLELFIGDLENRAIIDYIEDNWYWVGNDEEKYIKAGGKRFLDRYKKLLAIHPTIKPKLMMVM